MAERLQLKVRNFWELIPIFVGIPIFLNAIMFEHLFFNQNWGVKKLSYFFSSAMWKKDDHLSHTDADPRIMNSSTLLKLGLGNN